MYISLNWIKDFVNLENIDIHELGHKITMSMAEVEEVTEVGGDIKDVVVGKVVKVQKHPSSEKLSIILVDIGNETVQSVCGAPNVKEGILAPFAKLGGSIKKVEKVEKVEKVKLAGVESNGILCSSAELGISDDHSGLLILEGNYKPGTDIKEIIDIDDVIIEIDNKSLTNRPDLWGHYGVAREIAAIYNKKLKPLDVYDLEKYKNLPKLDISVEDKDKCFRYSGLTIDNLKVKVSPLNMQTRLYYCGMRAISLLVDLTNYLMLEVGQPMHAFDKQYMKKVVVKSTKETTKFTTLDDVERNIPQDVMMICNQDGPVALAGIMGGQNSEVSEDTDAILLESANFDGASIRKNATKIGIRTESSARFEKMLDPELTATSIKRFVKLLYDIDSDIKVSSALTDAYVKKYDTVTITIDKHYIDKYIGHEIDKDKIINILESLEFKVESVGNEFTVKVPSFRATKDILIKADIVEEVARIYGFENITPKTTSVVLTPLAYNEPRLMEHKIKEILAENYGLSEVHSHIWYDNKANVKLGMGTREGLKIINSSAEDMDTLRDKLAPIMVNFAVVNNKYYDEFGIFEIGSVFTIKDKKSLCEEHKNLCILLASKSESEDDLFYKSKGIVDSIFKIIKKVEPKYTLSNQILEYNWVHPVKSAEVIYNGHNFGYICVLHPKVKENIDKKLNIALIEINASEFYDIEETVIKYQELSKYPEVTFDLSLLVDKNISFDEINKNIGQFVNYLLIDYKFIDIYTGKGIPQDKKSITFGFRIGSKEHTLSSEEIENFRQDLIEYIVEKGYSLRY